MIEDRVESRVDVERDPAKDDQIEIDYYAQVVQVLFGSHGHPYAKHSIGQERQED